MWVGKIGKKPLANVVIVLIIIVLPLSFYLFFDSKLPPVPAAPKHFWKTPYWMLTNQDSSTVSSDDLKGFIYVSDFFFAHCNSVCPQLSQLMSKLQENYKSEPRFRLVSFTIDADHDNVKTLKEYAKKYGASPEKWYFLTGDAKYIRDTIAEKGFKVPVVPNHPDDGQFTHTDRFVLVDGDGMIRGFYGVLEPGQTDSLYNAIERLLVERKNTKGIQ
jgi:protein SCO1/2